MPVKSIEEYIRKHRVVAGIFSLFWSPQISNWMLHYAQKKKNILLINKWADVKKKLLDKIAPPPYCTFFRSKLTCHGHSPIVLSVPPIMRGPKLLASFLLKWTSTCVYLSTGLMWVLFHSLNGGLLPQSSLPGKIGKNKNCHC